MSRIGSDNIRGMNMTLSPSNMQYSENPSPAPSSIKSLYSKIISSCQRSELMSCSHLTPENKENINRMVSPFIIKRKVPFNPFNQNLKERLENPVLSPNVFSTAVSPSVESDEFKWTIDELSKIKPAQIEEEFHYEEQVDEQTESEMQNTIDRYFTKNHMVPSPWNCKLPTSWNSFREVFNKEKQKLLNQTAGSSSSPYSFSVSHLEVISKTPCQDVSTQTNLSFPEELPENIRSQLKPYFTETSVDDMNLSMNSSLRRKLFFHNDDEQMSPVSLFHVKEMSPIISNCYPSTPAIKLRSDYPPMQTLSSPLDISPITRIDKNAVCNNSYSVMQVDTSSFDRGIGNSEITQETEFLKVNTIQTNNLFGEVCFNVFESPKLAGGIRRSRKAVDVDERCKRRRRSFSQDDMSISYSNFATNHNSTKQTTQKFCDCDEESRMNVDVDTMSEFLTESQDTGYITGYTNSSIDKFTRNESNLKLASFNSWRDKNMESELIASTPTKKGI